MTFNLSTALEAGLDGAPEAESRLGENLRAWRRAAGLSLRDLARALGADAPSYASLSRYESGEIDPPWRMLCALARCYGVRVGVLVMFPPPRSLK